MFNIVKNQRKGQSTVEYIILVTAVVSVAILFLTNPSGPFQSRLNSTMGTVTGQMTNMADRLESSQAGAPAATP